MMANSVFIAKIPTDYKMNKLINKKVATTHATTNVIPINKFNNKNIYQNPTTHLFHKNRWRTPDQSRSRNKLCKFILAAIAITQINVSFISIIIHRVRQRMFFGSTRQYLWLALYLLMTLRQHVESLEVTTDTYKAKETETLPTKLYSQLLSTNGELSKHDNEKNTYSDDTFQPFVPKDPELISHNVFTPGGQFRVFQPIDTDLRAAVLAQHYRKNQMSEQLNSSLYPAHELQQRTENQKITLKKLKTHLTTLSPTKYQHKQHEEQEHHNKVERTHELKNKHEQDHERKYEHQHQYSQSIEMFDNEKRDTNFNKNDLTSDLKNLEDLLVDYVTNFFEKGQYEPMPGLLVELQNNHTQPLPNELTGKKRSVRQTTATDAKIKIDLPRTLSTGRLLFLTGLKKVLWPVFMGLQVLKSLLIAMFIPAIIGSLTKLLGKGISTGSAPLFIRPIEPPQELDFRDNSINFDDDKFLMTDEGIKDNRPYVYNQADATQMHNEYVFDPSSTNNQLAYTRLGMNERQHQLMQDSYMNALQSIGSASFKNSGSLSSSSSGLLAPMAKRPPPAANVNTFQQFQKVPDSSLLLSNYDPFYSPLLSRLDSVFAQLKINSDNEICREKLICLMYANPAKYAPYSNLVSAQLSRELNELRKPTSDNPDILRFFKYMRAAKDGQDGIDCEKTFDKCTEFKDFENPAMVSTYHDINKLVQARKLTNK